MKTKYGSHKSSKFSHWLRKAGGLRRSPLQRPILTGSIFSWYLGVNSYQRHVEAYLRYLILQLYWEYESILLVNIAARQCRAVVQFFEPGPLCCEQLSPQATAAVPVEANCQRALAAEAPRHCVIGPRGPLHPYQPSWNGGEEPFSLWSLP